MARELLLDTGALVSLLDRSQTGHRRFMACYEEWQGAVVSTEAVLTEASHLLARVPGGALACLDFFVRGGAVLAPTSRQTLVRCLELMRTYADLPMDYADATLVALGEELGTRLVMTTDRRDFGVYRLGPGSREAFEVLP